MRKLILTLFAFLSLVCAPVISYAQDVKLGVLYPLTGPVAQVGKDAVAAVKAVLLHVYLLLPPQVDVPPLQRVKVALDRVELHEMAQMRCLHALCCSIGAPCNGSAQS